MRNTQSIGFISALGLNIEASGASNPVCTAMGSTKKTTGKQRSPRVFCSACQHWHYWPIILTSGVRFSHTQQSQQAARAPIIVAAMKQERKLGFRDTVPLRSHLPVHFTVQNLVQQVHLQSCRCVPGSYRFYRAFESRAYYFIAAVWSSGY